MITISSSGSFKNTYKFLGFLHRREYIKNLKKFGERGVQALSEATPVRTGKTAASWGYEIDNKLNSIKITWTNSNLTTQNIPVAILIQYGHGTGAGVYVQGVDYINPALRPVFDEIGDEIWKEVTSA
jgi:hypothetical protein